jgi:SAM-dependent methyltransferase
MWDERYKSDEYGYGKIPVPFLRESIKGLDIRRALCLGAGEGRNAVWLAVQGFETAALDISGVGLDKVVRLAEEHNVDVETVKADITRWDPGQRQWDLITLFYLHLLPEERETAHRLAASILAPGGRIILQGFTPRQQGRGTGGPGGKNPGKPEPRLIEPEELAAQFPGLEILMLKELEIPLVGGSFHRGRGIVVRCIARKTETEL